MKNHDLRILFTFYEKQKLSKELKIPDFEIIDIL
jgi:hypothetical protein